MRVLLRVLAPLLGLTLAGAGVLVVLEVVAAWVAPDLGTGLIVPWQEWRADLAARAWDESPVRVVAIAVAVAGLLLAVLGLLARRSDIRLDGPHPEITVITSPRVLARLVGRRVRNEDVAGAAVTASRRKVSVTAQAWGDADAQLPDTVDAAVRELLDDLPLHRRPRVAVTVQDRKGPR